MSETDAQPDRDSVALAWEITLSALCGLIVTVIWGATGMGSFWPVWVWIGLGIPLGLHVAYLRSRAMPPGRERALELHRLVAIELSIALVLIWACAGLGFFWPIFPILAIGATYVIHASLISPRPRELAGRVDELTRTRRGALDVQAAELRRIERDLHDGAQARLVALSMQLGRAEERLGDRPEEAALVRQAREEASAAIAELRDLARGIAPPVLADRGLAAAIQSLADRSPSPVEVQATIEKRPPPVVETAAYFVVAESLTNAAKHAADAPVSVSVTQTARTLLLEIVDAGPGGANPAGGGLTGLRQRVEALDGTLAVSSEPGHGTTIRAVLPCE